MNESDLSARHDFLRTAERLKDTLRSGRTSSGRTESVAEHSWRLTLFVIVFADQLPGVDLLRLLKICVLHDLGEAICGDIPAPEQATLTDRSERERTDFQTLTATLPPHVRTQMLDLWDDYDQTRSSEARIARAFDKLEMLLQHAQGKQDGDFDFAFNLSYARRRTDALPLAAALRRLLDAETAARISSSATDRPLIDAIRGGPGECCIRKTLRISPDCRSAASPMG